MNKRQPVRGGLNITEPIAVSDQEKERIVEKWTRVTDKALSELEERGFTVPEQPKFSPEELNENTLIGTSPEEYARLFTQHLGWYNYAAPYMAEIKSRLNRIKTAMTNVETEIRDGVRKMNKTADRKEKMTEQELKDKVWLDPRYQELLEHKEEWDAKRELMASRMDAYDRNMKLISRIEEERKVDVEANRREGSLRRPQRQPRFHGQ